MSAPTLTPYAERLLAKQAGCSVLPAPRAPRPAVRPAPARSGWVAYCPKRRAEHLRHARRWLAEYGDNLTAYARAHGLSITLLYNAVQFARANPKAKSWPALPTGNPRQISADQLDAIRFAYDHPTPDEKRGQTAERIGVSRACLNHYFGKWRKGEAA
jgi:hypothetical protein